MNCEASSCLADVLGCVSGDGRRLALPAGSPWTLAAAGLPKKSVMLVSYRTLARGGSFYVARPYCYVLLGLRPAEDVVTTSHKSASPQSCKNVAHYTYSKLYQHASQLSCYGRRSAALKASALLHAAAAQYRCPAPARNRLRAGACAPCNKGMKGETAWERARTASSIGPGTGNYRALWLLKGYCPTTRRRTAFP